MLSHIASIRTATYNEEKTGGLNNFSRYLEIQRVSRRREDDATLYPERIPPPELPDPNQRHQHLS